MFKLSVAPRTYNMLRGAVLVECVFTVCVLGKKKKIIMLFTPRDTYFTLVNDFCIVKEPNEKHSGEKLKKRENTKATHSLDAEKLCKIK